jgi:hypothetical protein
MQESVEDDRGAVVRAALARNPFDFARDRLCASRTSKRAWLAQMKTRLCASRTDTCLSFRGKCRLRFTHTETKTEKMNTKAPVSFASLQIACLCMPY